MPTRDQVLSSLARGLDYPGIGRRLGVPAGQAFMIGTGLPADGSDGLAPGDERPGLPDGSSQHLANPAAEDPTRTEHVLDWVRHRAISDAPMREASARRDALPGAVEDPDDDRDVVVVLGRDHNQVKAMLEQVQALPGRKKGGSASDMSRRESIVDLITVALSQHEAVEEEHFWPSVRKRVPGGRELAERALAQEQEGTETLAALGKVAGDEERFDELVEELVARLRRHVAFEDRVFLAVKEASSARGRRSWGKKLQRSEKRAPTRPHPHAPRAPSGAAAAAGAAGATLDKLRDAGGSRPADRKGRPADGTSA